MQCLPKSHQCFCQKHKKLPSIHMDFQGPPNSQNNIEKKNQGLILPDFKIYCKAVVSKTVWY